MWRKMIEGVVITKLKKIQMKEEAFSYVKKR